MLPKEPGHGRPACTLAEVIPVEAPWSTTSGSWRPLTVSRGEFWSRHNFTLNIIYESEGFQQLWYHQGSLCLCIFFLLLSTSVNDITVYLGRQFQQLPNPNEVSRRVSRIINHPNYNSVTQNNDISLLMLSSSVTFTNFIKPVCLAAANSVYGAGTSSWITGWGAIRSNGEKVIVKFLLQTNGFMEQKKRTSLTVKRHKSGKNKRHSAMLISRTTGRWNTLRWKDWCFSIILLN